MVRKIIEIDEEKCDGCGLCVRACHEGAIALEKGKAKLIRDDYCDGLGNCLPVCPTGAISFTLREAADYDVLAVEKNIKAKAGTCPGAASKRLVPEGAGGTVPGGRPSELGQWPVQIKLVPVNAPYFEDASLLVAADCSAYARGDFHAAFMRDRITLIGCPKLDSGDYSEKLGAILESNTVKSLTVVRMEVPCCGGIAAAATSALKASGKNIPFQVVTLTLKGEIVKDR